MGKKKKEVSTGAKQTTVFTDLKAEKKWSIVIYFDNDEDYVRAVERYGVGTYDPKHPRKRPKMDTQKLLEDLRKEE